MITRCPCCVGKKTIVGLGAMIKDCPNCKGVGHVTVVLDHDKIKIHTDVESVSRRGRPKKVSDKEANLNELSGL